MKKLNFSQMEVLNGGQTMTAGPWQNAPCLHESNVMTASAYSVLASAAAPWTLIFFPLFLDSIKNFKDCTNQGTMATY